MAIPINLITYLDRAPTQNKEKANQNIQSR